MNASRNRHQVGESLFARWGQLDSAILPCHQLDTHVYFQFPGLLAHGAAGREEEERSGADVRADFDSRE